jgi:hypothetical protein
MVCEPFDNFGVFLPVQKASYMPCESRENGMTPKSPSVKTISSRLTVPVYPAAQFLWNEWPVF